MIIGIVAISKNFAIGKGGKLPWHYPADLKFFKEQTMGNAILMGRKTFESIGKPLPGRLNIVLSRSAAFEKPPGVLLLRSKLDIIELSAYLKCNIFIIGGAEIYREFADEVEHWVVTHIPMEVEGADAFLPGSFLDDFDLRHTSQLDGDLLAKIYERRRYEDRLRNPAIIC